MFPAKSSCNCIFGASEPALMEGIEARAKKPLNERMKQIKRVLRVFNFLNLN
jgi:hypothetical protein